MESFLRITNFKTVVVPFFSIKNLKSRNKLTEFFFSINNFKSFQKVIESFFQL